MDRKNKIRLLSILLVISFLIVALNTQVGIENSSYSLKSKTNYNRVTLSPTIVEEKLINFRQNQTLSQKVQVIIRFDNTIVKSVAVDVLSSICDKKISILYNYKHINAIAAIVPSKQYSFLVCF